MDTKAQIAEAQQLLSICREYILGLSMKIVRKEKPKVRKLYGGNDSESTSLPIPSTCTCIHNYANASSFNFISLLKIKNLKTASSFARRLLELGPKPEVANQVCDMMIASNSQTLIIYFPFKTGKILQACGQNPVDTHKLQYDQHNPFSICGASYTPIYRYYFSYHNMHACTM